MKKKQAVAFLLSTTMAVGGAVQAFGAASDIGGHWAQATIAKWQDAGRIGGYEDGTFKPDRTITRAEFVRLLNRATSTSFPSNLPNTPSNFPCIVSFVFPCFCQPL